MNKNTQKGIILVGISELTILILIGMLVLLAMSHSPENTEQSTFDISGKGKSETIACWEADNSARESKKCSNGQIRIKAELKLEKPFWKENYWVCNATYRCNAKPE